MRQLALSSADLTTPPLSAATLYRFLNEQGLNQKQLLQPPAHKKSETEVANQIWQSKMMFGPASRDRAEAKNRRCFMPFSTTRPN